MTNNSKIVGLVKITDNNKDSLVDLAMSMYIGEKCICGDKFKNLEDLKEVVWYPHKEGRIIHKECWNAK